MIYKFIFPALTLFFASTALAEVRGFICQKTIAESSLKATISAVEKRYSTVTSLQGRFTQHAYLEALESSELSQGRMTFLKPGKMKWVYEEPEAQEFISDGTTLWLYQPIDNQVLVDKFRSAVRGDLPVSFLLGIGSLSRDFKLKGGCQSDGGIVLDLSPAKSEEGVQTMKLLVNPTTNLPAGAEIIDAAGNKNTFLLSGLQVNPQLDATFFAPRFAKGTDVIDNRVQ